MMGAKLKQGCWPILAGVVAGYLVGSVIFRYNPLPCIDDSQPFQLAARRIYKFETDLEQATTSKYYTDKNLVFVAVMTTKRFLGTRALAARDTWVKSIPGKVVFFSSEGSEHVAIPGIEVVGLRGVDDAYPPQKKSFLTLKYMHDNYLDRFRFFMRADDDIYIKGEELARLLHSVKSTGMPVIGSPGFGNSEELGKLYLRDDGNYCMGGPGLIMTKEILKKTVPNISYCLKNLLTAHEDVELGRCIKKFANVSCVWSSEPLFRHSYESPHGAFSGTLHRSSILRALTLHPFKIPSLAYRLHQYLLSLKTDKLRSRQQSLSRQISTMNILLQERENSFPKLQSHPKSSRETERRTRDDIESWNFISDHSQHTSSGFSPRRVLNKKRIAAIKEVSEEIWVRMHLAVRHRGRRLRRRDVHVIYSQISQISGQTDIVDIRLRTPDYSTDPKTVKDRYIYAYRPFVETEIGINLVEDHSMPFRVTTEPHENRKSDGETTKVPVNFILPLAGKYSAFLSFIKNFEDQCLKTNQHVSLLVMLFRNKPNDTSGDVTAYVSRLKRTYDHVSLDVALLDGGFSRGVALQAAVKRFRENDLLFFLDVDVFFDSSALQRIRLNTLKGHTVYAPIVFSYYDPQYLPRNTLKYHINNIAARFNQDVGYWRQYGFGMLSIYKSDFDKTGGFKQKVKGWGLEDVDLIEKFIRSNITVFRAVDVGLYHKFHPIICYKNLKKKQYDMCIGSKLSTMASTSTMSDIVYRTPEILNRHENMHARPSAGTPKLKSLMKT